MSIILSASIMCADPLNLHSDICQLEQAGIDWIHVDIMDGHFVPNLTFGPWMVKALKGCTGLTIDTHLMVSDPDRYALEFADLGSDYVVFHLEAVRFPIRTITALKAKGARVGIAPNPATPVESLEHLLSDLDIVLVMAVEPGFAGQAFIPGTVEKVARLRRMLRERQSEALIEVDGNINPETVPSLVAAGADALVGGSSGLFLPGCDLQETSYELRKAAESGLRRRG